MWTRGDRPLIFAHRGASRRAPENTLAAFALAARLGADGVELDAQLCATGEVVVLHDETLARTTGHMGLLRETPWSTVRALDAGARFGPAFAGERVPLLADVLAETPPSLLVNVELKCEELDDRGLTAAALRVISDAGAEGRVLLSSFNPLCLARAKALRPSLPRALLFERGASWPLRRALAAGPLGVVALHPEASLATPRALQRWRRKGYAVAAWTVDDVALARQLWRSGATGIITNQPDVMLAGFR